MAEAQYAPHHTIDPQTGFTENKSYPTAFDASRKTEFIRCMVENGLGLYDVCDTMNLSHHTLFKHYHNDPVFKEALDEARFQYGSRLDAISKKNAMNPKSVIERIFQLKAIFPETYADKRTESMPNITINVDSQLLSKVTQREAAIEVEIINQLDQPESRT